jgi:hypothetical protein
MLEELLLVAICAVISGAESWASVAEWGEPNSDGKVVTFMQSP